MLQQSPAIDWPSRIEAGAAVRREDRYRGLHRLICAAISSAPLAALLLVNPSRVRNEYAVGRSLTDEEYHLVLSVVGAPDIYEFAGHLHALTMQSQARDRITRDYQTMEVPIIEVAAPEAHLALAAA